MPKKPVPPLEEHLPDDDHAARYIDFAHLDTANGGRIMSTAFQPRPQDHNRLSVSWIEPEPGNALTDKILNTKSRMKDYIKPYNPNGKISAVNVRRVKLIECKSNQIQVRQARTRRNNNHSVIVCQPNEADILDVTEDLAILADDSLCIAS